MRESLMFLPICWFWLVLLWVVITISSVLPSSSFKRLFVIHSFISLIQAWRLYIYIYIVSKGCSSSTALYHWYRPEDYIYIYIYIYIYAMYVIPQNYFSFSVPPWLQCFCVEAVAAPMCWQDSALANRIRKYVSSRSALTKLRDGQRPWKVMISVYMWTTQDRNPTSKLPSPSWWVVGLPVYKSIVLGDAITVKSLI